MAQRPAHQQPSLVDDPVTGYRHRYCRRCGRELTRLESRLNGFGAACDPNRHPAPAPTHEVEQDTLPGT